MAPLPNSGQLSLHDIATEQGVGLTQVSLNALSDNANFSEPDAVSDFYGWGKSTKFWKMSTSNDRLVWRNSTPILSGYTQNMSFSFWYRNDLAVADNLLFFDLYPQNTTTNANRMFLSYTASTNVFVFRYRSASQNFDRQFPLHNGNGSITGVTDDQLGWCTTQRGNVNAKNFSHITAVYHGTEADPEAVFKLYWNGQELTETAVQTTGTRTNFGLTEITWGNDYNSGTGDASGYDEMRIYDTNLSVVTPPLIYNNGNPVTSATDQVTTNLVFEDRAELATPVDSTGNWSRYISSGASQNL